MPLLARLFEWNATRRSRTPTPFRNPYRFVGGTYEKTTCYVKFGQRWYDPTTGRFTTQDKLSFLANPDRGNHYAYAGDDPINNIDPTGKSFLASLSKVGGYAWKSVNVANDLATVGKMWNATLDGDYGKAVGIGFGLAVGKAVEGACIGVPP
ncbi:RHS repeat-associated core domain-containing protein [Streptomyces sp. Tu6071]|uniref:RHS repeat-associated core domain-containing protein n=1 Tax=Streptomyces sp. Tu6071 TaxID=355249 RepID=UPI001F2BB1BE|nr:RHS repeat-associated core domain-containing protein [Streptomyces sp. Tu6071]